MATGLDSQAQDILRTNDRGGYTVPTAGLYPYQWNWDSAFAALGFAQFDMDRAWVELETLFAGQWDDGMVPHILHHVVNPGYFPGPEVWGCNGPSPSSGISQPPVAGTIVRKIYDLDPVVGEARARRLFPKLRRWHDWFLKWRSHEGAICITHPWESGRDNTPDWDGAMARIDPKDVGEYDRRDTSHVDNAMRPTRYDYDRYIWLVQRGRRLGWDQAQMAEDNPFFVADPTMTFTLLRSHRDILALGEALSEDVAGMADDIAQLEAGAESLWNNDLQSYDVRDTVNGAWANCISNASFLNWYAGIPSDGQAKHLDRIMDLAKYPLPSHDPASPKFEPKRYWRGPTWSMMNMMIGEGLIAFGLPQGERLRDATMRLIRDHGFSEYFDPTDGSPAGGQSFTWTAAIWLAWASPNARRA
ncbi:hypothetical protein SLH49_08870 [Cognatiyoonia sp. IB215446]|uniref:MGH1-like glycoside hydrolase domain-containing protein n=1 Tax=Cognatiyoonia sp. IB215446 TaxID=3097355 RepID=UPI002A0EE71D|nr:hypothetical protein [Cognatiyoonia sp. IB215446]MDX8348097.1 hypothetical protein [Cognatiyoonia sp. IB215446]